MARVHVVLSILLSLALLHFAFAEDSLVCQTTHQNLFHLYDRSIVQFEGVNGPFYNSRSTNRVRIISNENSIYHSKAWPKPIFCLGIEGF